jgi:hypothetical protein
MDEYDHALGLFLALFDDDKVAAWLTECEKSNSVDTQKAIQEKVNELTAQYKVLVEKNNPSRDEIVGLCLAMFALSTNFFFGKHSVEVAMRHHAEALIKSNQELSNCLEEASFCLLPQAFQNARWAMEASSKAQEFSLRSINVTQTAIQIADVAEAKNLANRQARQKGAIKRHEENRQLKADAFKWLDENFQTLKSKGKSMDAIAEDLKGIVPVSFRTRRDWVTEWKKTLC